MTSFSIHPRVLVYVAPQTVSAETFMDKNISPAGQ